MKKLPRSKIPAATTILLKKQGYRCPLCNGSLKANASKQPVLDHCHRDGHIRAVLCRNCNGIEGKVFNLMNRAKNDLTVLDWARNLMAYWELHTESQHGLMHHTHLTEEEKRLKRNKKARERRAKLKAMK